MTADLAFYAYRDMAGCDWRPFVKAAVERNPVAIEKTASMSVKDVHQWLAAMNNGSIYEGPRLAQPDELANYATGDGLEKAFVLADVIRAKEPQNDIEIEIGGQQVVVRGGAEYRFESAKRLEGRVGISADGEISVSR